MDRIRINEFFRDFDKLRKGIVTVGQFERVLCSLKLHLTDIEYKAIINKYLLPNPTGDPTKDLVNYRSFCEYVDLPFTQKGLEKDPGIRIQMPSIQDANLARRKQIVKYIYIYIYILCRS